jgi:Flp pilus assembly protein TadG
MPAFRLSCLSRRGASTVEFAFVAPVFFMIVLGLIEIGRACMVTELLTEAARRACRVGIIEGTGSSAIQSAATNFLTNVGISGEFASVYLNDTLVSSSSPASSIPAYTEVTVVVTVPASAVAWTPVGYVTGTLSGQYTMREE